MNSAVSRYVLVLIFVALPAAAQSLKLNGPLASEVSGSIGFPATSPDGRTLVYVADRDDGHAFELYALSSDGTGGPLQLSGAIEAYGGAQITPDARRVLFLADMEASGAASQQLLGAPLDGSAPPSVLSGPLVVGGNVIRFEASRDGLHAVYFADQHVDELFELFSVPVSGGAAPVGLSGVLAPVGDVRFFSLSNDGRLVVYLADQDADEVVELFVVPVDGSSPARRLPIPLVAGGDVVSFQLDPDASHAIYTADQEEDERFELFTIPTDGSHPPLKLNGPLVPGGDVSQGYGPFYLSPTQLSLDGQWIVYSADQDTDERFELYSVPADGSLAAVKLSTPSDHEPVLSSLSHDSAWAIYGSDPSSTDTYEIFSAPIDGSAPARRISGPMVSGGDAYFPVVSYDSSRVVYAADQDVDQVNELYSAPIDGSAPPVKLNAPMPPGGDLALAPGLLLPGFYVMAAGVVYEADQEVDGLNETYLAPLAGGAAPRKLVPGPYSWAYPAYANQGSPPSDFARVYFLRERTLFSIRVEPGAQPIPLDTAKSSLTVGDVGDFLLSASGERVVYRAREEGDEELGELYSVRTDKPRERVRLRSGQPPGGFQAAMFFTPDERRVIYSTFDPLTNAQDLYIEPVDGSAPPVQLNSLPAGGVIGGAGGDFDGVVFLPDGQRLAFLANVGAPARVGLFVTPVDASSPPLLLTGDLDLYQGLEVSTDGSRIAFRSAESPARLYVVATDGSAPPRAVENPPGSFPGDLRLSPDGQRVFFRASRRTRIDLFVAPSDASAAPLQLNAPFQSRGAVTAFALDPLGLRVVYLADQEIYERFELYSVLADGSTAPVRLHAPLSGGLDVEDFQISADAARVVLRGDLRTDGVVELFSAPLDASRAPALLSGSPASGPGVLDYRISPDGQRVVYRAYRLVQEGYGPRELFSASIHGSRAPAKLSRQLVPGGQVGQFQISADSRTVAFTAERLALPPGGEHDPGPPLTLLTAPIQGQEKASEIAGPFHDTGTVSDFQLSADGSVVVYLADQDEPFTVELYAVRRMPAPAIRAAK